MHSNYLENKNPVRISYAYGTFRQVGMCHMHKNSSGVIQQTLIRFPVSYCKNIQFSIFNFQFSFYTTSKLKIHTLGAKADSHYKINSKKGVLYI